MSILLQMRLPQAQERSQNSAKQPYENPPDSFPDNPWEIFDLRNKIPALVLASIPLEESKLILKVA